MTNQAPHRTCIEATDGNDIAAGVRTFICSEDCPPPPRTAAATAGRMRASENRKADLLESRGWMCFPPEEVAAIAEILTRAGWKVRNPR